MSYLITKNKEMLERMGYQVNKIYEYDGYKISLRYGSVGFYIIVSMIEFNSEQCVVHVVRHFTRLLLQQLNGCE